MKIPPPTNSGSPSTTVIVLVAAILEISSRPQKTATITAYDAARGGRERRSGGSLPRLSGVQGGHAERSYGRGAVLTYGRSPSDTDSSWQAGHMSDYPNEVPDESEQLDQTQSERLLGRSRR